MNESRAGRGARFTSPFALLALLGATFLAAPHSLLAMALLVAQIGGYALGAASLAIPAFAAFTGPRLIGFFLLVNAAVMNAWFYHLSGQRSVKWEPTRR